MPAIATNARKFLINSDYPLDKVILLKSGSFTVADAAFGEHLVPHGLPFIPLPMGNWSTEASFDVAYEFDTGPISTSSANAIYRFSPTLSADANNLRLAIGNYYGGSAVTINYRVYCLAPSNVDPATLLSKTAVEGDKFALNSAYNYTKLHSSGIVEVPDHINSSQTLIPAGTHLLGYRPQVVMWIERAGMMMPKTQGVPVDGSIDMLVTDTSISVSVAYAAAARVHYRVYLDD